MDPPLILSSSRPKRSTCTGPISIRKTPHRISRFPRLLWWESESRTGRVIYTLVNTESIPATVLRSYRQLLNPYHCPSLGRYVHRPHRCIRERSSAVNETQVSRCTTDHHFKTKKHTHTDTRRNSCKVSIALHEIVLLTPGMQNGDR